MEGPLVQPLTHFEPDCLQHLWGRACAFWKEQPGDGSALTTGHLSSETLPALLAGHISITVVGSGLI